MRKDKKENNKAVILSVRIDDELNNDLENLLGLYNDSFPVKTTKSNIIYSVIVSGIQYVKKTIDDFNDLRDIDIK